MRTAEHYFQVPLDHFSEAGRRGETISVFAREYVSTEHSEAEAAGLPWLLFLQGGPGGRGNRFPSLGGWSKAAAKDFRILMLDQRGTGLSSPVDRNTLPLRGTDAEQADYLTHFRADSIVADAEAIRAALGSAPWTIYGQSYGGFCALSYLSFAPEGLREVLVTGGLAPLGGSADRVYRATFQRVAARNAEYFGWYPEDRAAVTRIARHLRETEEVLPDGGRLTVERFQMVGSFLGGNTRVDALHHLLEDAFVATPDGDRLSDAFLEQVRGLVSRAANPLYALMHESIYGQGGATNWAAWRVLEEFPEFRPDAAEPLLTGEMVYPWYFEQDPALRPLQDVARLLARKGRLGAAVRSGATGAEHRARRRGRLHATTSTWTGSCPWRRRPRSGACRSGKPATSTMTASRTTARRSSGACWAWPVPPAADPAAARPARADGARLSRYA